MYPYTRAYLTPETLAAFVSPPPLYNTWLVKYLACGNYLNKLRDLRNSHYPQAIVALTSFPGGELWVESPKGSTPKNYMGGTIYSTQCDLSSGAPLLCSGKSVTLH